MSLKYVDHGQVWRYYLLAIRPESSDANFNWKDFAGSTPMWMELSYIQLNFTFVSFPLPLVPSSDRNNGELLSNLGNFVNRSLKFAYDRFDRRIPGLGAPSTQAENDLVKSVSACVSVALMLVPCMGSLLQKSCR
jgi:methionyl-tRNA synthetase